MAPSRYTSGRQVASLLINGHLCANLVPVKMRMAYQKKLISCQCQSRGVIARTEKKLVRDFL